MTIDRFTPRNTESFQVQERRTEGCPCRLTHLYQTTWQVESRTPMVHQFTPMALVNEGEDSIKTRLNLRRIHGELEMESLPLNIPKGPNVVLAKVSFECLVQRLNGFTRGFFTFDLRIPCTSRDGSLTWSWLERAYEPYGGILSLYQTLRFFYQLGRQIANPENKKHGHFLNYDSNNPSYDQFIRHSEQTLAAYLALPQASEMLSNRLKVTVRAKYADAMSMEVLNMALHLHSTKRCCAGCEYVLLGLMNDKTEGHGLFNNLGHALGDAHTSLPAKIKAAFKAVVTVTANQPDAIHKTLPRLTLSPERIRSFNIDLNDPDVSKYIYTTLLTHGYDRRKVTSSPQINHISVVLSGSLATATSKSALSTVRNLRKENIENPDDLSDRLFHLSLRNNT